MLILGSGSPRRKELLSLITPLFVIDTPEVDETLPEGVVPQRAVMLLARRKAEAVAARHTESDIIIGSDTIVVLDGEILGKPKDREDAKAMLRRLSGETHRVFTGVCVHHDGKSEMFYGEASVVFATMTDSEIDEYLDTGEPFDKAGAYGVQGFGSRYIERIDGDYYAVVGLPVHQLYRVLRPLLHKNEL